MGKGFRQLIEEGNTVEYEPLSVGDLKEYMKDIFLHRTGPKQSLFKKVYNKIFVKQPEWSWYGKSLSIGSGTGITSGPRKSI